mmetsp:Transcript_12558/g.34835  ORF Transcript_12558/g.34835 Transcript_12558/m.34835 type:complete len:124 (-) Transcript_12558:12-383(-)
MRRAAFHMFHHFCSSHTSPSSTICVIKRSNTTTMDAAETERSTGQAVPDNAAAAAPAANPQRDDLAAASVAFEEGQAIRAKAQEEAVVYFHKMNYIHAKEDIKARGSRERVLDRLSNLPKPAS